MRLIGFRVTNFRSVRDSTWIEVDGVTALIGVNESGKTNLLTPLWKLNPAREGEIQGTADFPKRIYGDVRAAPGDYSFVQARFDVGARSARLASLAGISEAEAKEVDVLRFFDDTYAVSFPNCKIDVSIEPTVVKSLFAKALKTLQQVEALKSEEQVRTTALALISELERSIASEPLDHQDLAKIIQQFKTAIPEPAAKTSILVPRIIGIAEELEKLHATLILPAPQDRSGVYEAVIEALPKFVYYSNYGNLDSEIYLPHVVENLKRKDLGPKEAAKARTLRVLFKFVGLQPSEILELGKDFNPAGGVPTLDEIAAIAERKRERAILLQSAGTMLTAKFKEWWKQGDYRFRFDADGDHFRIWVADDRRPEEIELESRSTGLQWFLSFYLVFLVESEGEHQRAVLLLDEPGLSLHPLAQRDLSQFFDNLSSTNQILYTTHSPFLVDADRLDRVRKVFVAEDGTTQASPDLRQSSVRDAQTGAAYAVYSALNLNLAESLLLGCQPVVVEGTSDQHYLTMMKVLLIGAGRITPTRELVFPPSGGTKTLRITAGILTGRDDRLPVVLLDGDEMGRRMGKELQTSLYAGEREKVLSTDTYAGFKDSELEDLIPSELFAESVDRWERRADVPFKDVTVAGQPVIPQVERWAAEQGVGLPLGWKVEVSKHVKRLALDRGASSIPVHIFDVWTTMFQDFLTSAKDG